MSNTFVLRKSVVRRRFESHRQSLKTLHREIRQTRDALPAGLFDDETGEPLDLAGALRSIVDLLEDDGLDPMAEHLDRAVRWIDGREKPPRLSAEGRPVKRVFTH